jgi:MFS family permease
MKGSSRHFPMLVKTLLHTTKRELHAYSADTTSDGTRFPWRGIGSPTANFENDMHSTIDPALFGAGFLLGALCMGAIGLSFADEHGHRKVIPPTIVVSLCGGLAVGWATNFFVHYVIRSGQ